MKEYKVSVSDGTIRNGKYIEFVAAENEEQALLRALNIRHRGDIASAEVELSDRQEYIPLQQWSVRSPCQDKYEFSYDHASGMFSLTDSIASIKAKDIVVETRSKLYPYGHVDKYAACLIGVGEIEIYVSPYAAREIKALYDIDKAERLSKALKETLKLRLIGRAIDTAFIEFSYGDVHGLCLCFGRQIKHVSFDACGLCLSESSYDFTDTDYFKEQVRALAQKGR